MTCTHVTVSFQQAKIPEGNNLNVYIPYTAQWPLLYTYYYVCNVLFALRVFVYNMRYIILLLAISKIRNTIICV